MTETWLTSTAHRKALARDALRQFDFFRASLSAQPGFRVLDWSGAPLPATKQELHTTTRLVHSYALGKLSGVQDCDTMIDQGMDYLQSHHLDRTYGGYFWALDGDVIADDRKLAYGHVFVLLAASSAKLAGHPDADKLIENVTSVLEQQFWDPLNARFADEWNRDWSPFSTYRGMNANMHAVEALLAAFEATGRESYLDKAGKILAFFMHHMAPQHGWRLPEHYTQDWRVDTDYSGDPMFRPAGTTPGHSFELARLMLQHWDLSGRRDPQAPEIARQVADQAFSDAWLEGGGIAYTLRFDGTTDIRDRYWWPVTEAIGVYASLLKLENRTEHQRRYETLWQFADAHFIDHDKGGWFPEIDASGRPTTTQFVGKPDIYHAVQANLFPLTKGLSRQAETLPNLPALAEG